MTFLAFRFLVSALQAAVACLIRDKDKSTRPWSPTRTEQLGNAIAALPQELINAPLPGKATQKSAGNLLLWAVRNGNVTAVKLLIARGADVNVTCTPKRSCALMSACFEGFDGLARILLSAGADVNQSNEQG